LCLTELLRGIALTQLRPARICKSAFEPAREKIIKHAAKTGQLEEIHKGLNYLSSTRWKVNGRILKVMEDGLKSVDGEPPVLGKAIFEHHRLPLNIARAVRPPHPPLVSCLALTCSSQFRNHPFYLPHALDYRGRAYPMTPYLQPSADDISRGLLTFDRARPLGEHGLRWLKIHLSGVWGFDKASMEEREDWVDAHLEDIKDSASDPLSVRRFALRRALALTLPLCNSKGRRWWMTGDKKFQTLAAAIELAEALKLDDPRTFESSLPVHQDGTCNGLQYYVRSLLSDIRLPSAEPLGRPLSDETSSAPTRSTCLRLKVRRMTSPEMSTPRCWTSSR
jgi:DNA-directed RNA polymerase, mitochondrial